MTTKKTLEELLEQHGEMLATANDLGLTVPAELQSEFTDAGAGQGIIDALDTLIKEHQKGEKVLATDDKKKENKSSVQKPKKATGKKKAATKKVDAPPPPLEEKQVAAKKTAKKAAAKKSATANARTKVSDEAKIVKLKDNPGREGSGRFDRIANVLKHNGKTVKTFLSTGKGKRSTLSWCVRNKIVKLQGAA